LTNDPPSSPGDLLTRDHRRLDELLGRFLGAPDGESAARAIAEFDAALRAHTRLEEEHVFPAAPGDKLVPSPDESERDRLFRELRVEHVQIRELSGMIVRKLGETGDPGAAFALAGNLARRWDAHTAREEQEAFLHLGDSIDAAGEAAVRKALADVPR
jgi:Hemerythrin HHE cation binding domain